MAASEPPRYTSRNTLIIAGFSFAMFVLATRYHRPAAPLHLGSSELTESTTTATQLVRATLDQQLDFAALGFEFDSVALADALPFLTYLGTTPTISPAALTKALLWTDTRGASDRVEVRDAFLSQLVTLPLDDDADFPPYRAKSAAEHLLLAFAAPDQPPCYNAASRSLTQVYRRGTWQCASGTLAFSLCALREPTESFLNDHFVLIYERGHVLPGFMRQLHGEWQLYGLEMTVLGAGYKTYGPTRQLGDQGYGLRVVSAPAALIWQALSPYATPANATAVAVKILRATARTYDLPLNDLERNIRDLAAATAAHPNSPNAPTETSVVSAWAFGSAATPEGDTPFARINRLPIKDNLLPFTEISADGETAFPLPVTDESDAVSPSRGHIVYPWDPSYPK